MNLAFMGSDPIVLPLLEYLRKDAPRGLQLKVVFTQPDRRTGRGMHLRPNPVKAWALENGIEVRQPVKCGPDDVDFLRDQSIDLVLVMAYGQILSRAFLETPPKGVYNLHASLLPRLRGASPIHTAVALGHTETGVCLMKIIPKLDAGPVGDLEKVRIDPGDLLGDVQLKLAEACPRLLSRALPLLVENKLQFRPQDESKVSYCRIIEKSDCHLDFTRTARELLNRIHAFRPWPGTSFPAGGIEVRILDAKAEAAHGGARQPGTVLEGPPGSLRIACGTGSLQVLRLQRPGGKPLPVDAFLRGFPMEAGQVLESRPMKELEAAEPFPYRRK